MFSDVPPVWQWTQNPYFTSLVCSTFQTALCDVIKITATSLYQSIVQSILLCCSTCFLNMLSVKNKLTRNNHHSFQNNWSPHTKPNRFKQQGHNTHCNLNRTGHHTSTKHPPHPTPFRTQVQSNEVQKGSPWKSLIPAVITALNKRPRWTGQSVDPVKCLTLFCFCFLICVS